jgi:histidinol-phosphate aminotransferase
LSKYWNPLLRSIQPYIPGEQPQDKRYIKLNTNENPFPPSPRALEAIRRAAGEDLRLYPDPDCRELRETLASSFNLAPEQVFVGNGSDEVLAFSFLAFFDPGHPILFPDITYSFYPVYAALFKIEHRTVPLSADFSLPVEPFLQKNGGIVFPNPNAPTGKFLPLDKVELILERNPESVVIIDEAYVAFGGESAARFVNKYPNLLITSTFSKSHSLAGLRVGYALGNRELIDGLNRVKGSFNSYTLDRLALAGAKEALLDREYFEQTRAAVMATRGKTAERLAALGFEVVPSCANFLFVSHRTVRASKIYRLLKEKGILVRYFNRPRIDNFLRISIGSDKDMDSLLSAVAETVSKPQ